MPNFDDMKLAIEAMSGGKNTVLLDDQGMPSVMVAFPKFKISDVITGGSENIHPAFSIGGVEKAVRKLGELAQISKVHPHKFRRTLATMAIDKGMPIEQVQNLLGHKNINTTMQYAMVNTANVKNSHRKIIG